MLFFKMIYMSVSLTLLSEQRSRLYLLVAIEVPLQTEQTFCSVVFESIKRKERSF